ncbi:MAG TPA: glycerol-3-phosphate acyltransferase [Dehalococcoidia bacterium]|jgi:glycerol-3-phosphate acyltransferase PlsY
MRFLLVALLGYLIGALPIAYLVTRLLTGRDIRKLGTGNVGVMNTIRQAGLPAGMIVFLAEGGKGVAAVAVGHALTGRVSGALLCALLALVGVNWSVFVGFAGGRGSTLCVFVCLIIAPLVLLASAGVWLAVYTIRRDNFIATRVNILSFPLLTLAITRSWPFFVFASLGSLIVLLRHDRRTDDHYQLAAQPVPTDK